MNTMLRLLGVVVFIGLPLLTFWLDQRFDLPFGSLEVFMMAVLVGLLSGTLCRSWWFVGSILVIWLLWSGYAVVATVTDDTSRDSPLVVVLIGSLLGFAPALGGAAVGTLVGKVLEQRLIRSTPA